MGGEPGARRSGADLGGVKRRDISGGGGEGGEVGGAGGVVGGADAQVKVDGEEEVELEGVELGEGEAADARPAMFQDFDQNSYHQFSAQK